ncbi:helix-turn-helix domain-containing protein [Microlunatus parietis]|uniref:AraC-like DNA-binding protein n=1 Tax=Microlunatus parietis TaxID=682979 RepID=A0A7Y9I4K8_9ACTN|nr:helix-turn-helix domain-containing protein [Microlunatus parietis]NYE70160.1 AraC-like DNA-binding protein [Microlunatus parietis]
MSGAGPLPHPVDVTGSELWLHRGTPPTMVRPHRHDDLEVNLVLRGRLDYLFGGDRLSVTAGQVAVFWAATPHHLLPSPEQTEGCWLHLPLGTALGWNLTDTDVARLLSLTPVIAPQSCLGHDAVVLFGTWIRELGGSDAAARIPALLEIQAMISRVLRYDERQPDRHDQQQPAPEGTLNSVTAMARFIVENFRDSITIGDIAAAAHLNRSHAAMIFSRSLGLSPGRYLARRRIAEAQRLLITTGLAMIDVAHASGFSSQSSFYEQFTRLCGTSPGDYRRRHQRPG